MKIPIQRTIKKSLLAAIIAMSITGCTPKEEDYAALYSGTWNGTCVCTGDLKGTDKLTFTAVDKKTVHTMHSIGDSGCTTGHQMSGTVNKNTMTIPSMTVSDNCGVAHNVSAGGTLSGNTLTFIYSETGAVNGLCTLLVPNNTE